MMTSKDVEYGKDVFAFSWDTLKDGSGGYAIKRPPVDGEHLYLIIPEYGIAFSFWKDGAVMYLSKHIRESIQNVMREDDTRIAIQKGVLHGQQLDLDLINKLVERSRLIHPTEELR